MSNVITGVLKNGRGGQRSVREKGVMADAGSGSYYAIIFESEGKET